MSKQHRMLESYMEFLRRKSPQELTESSDRNVL